MSTLKATFVKASRVLRAKGLGWLGVAALGWLTVAVTGMALVTWPAPVGGYLAGFATAVGLAIWMRAGSDADLEHVYVRKDLAVETAMGIAFEAQQLEARISGEHVALREPADGEAVEPPEWALDGSVTPRRYPARCDWCGRPATQFSEQGPRCDSCPHDDRPYTKASEVRL